MKLKAVRIVVSLVFFAAYAAVFAGLISAYSSAAKFFVSFQAVPQLALFVSTGAASGIIFFLLVIASAAAGGRLYCSFICPLGFFQDIFINLRYRMKRRFKNTANHRIPRYILAALAFILFFIGFPWLMNLLEPFSNFGRIGSGVLEPAATWLRNAFVSLLEFFDVYSVKRHEANHVIPAVFAYTAGFVVFLGVLSLFRGRIYCNLLCPAGALLGIAAKRSFFALKVEETKCNSCGVCGYECKAECIDTKSGVIDNERCVMCFNCVDACSKGAVKYSAPAGKRGTDKTKRQVLKGIAGAAAALAASTLPVKLEAQSMQVVKKNPLITPPGSGSLERFKKTCIACGLCVTECPTKVLTPSFLEYGPEAVFVPRLDFSADYCLYDCTRCSHACPAGAIQKISNYEKKHTQLGVAKFITQNCLVETQGRHCTICNEFCPTKAVSLVPHKNGPDIPKVIEEICIGCGACEYMCPVMPKAIYVEGSAVHGRAGNPRRHGGGSRGKAEEKPAIKPQGDFPF